VTTLERTNASINVDDITVRAVPELSAIVLLGLALTRIAGRYENAGDRLVVAQYAVVQILVQVAHPCGHDLPSSQWFSVKLRSRIFANCSRAENLVGVFQ